MSKMETKRNGNFIDEFGACKVCDGEIPHGHTDNCDIWKLEKEIKELKGKIYGTNHFSPDPADWGLESMLKGACGQRDNLRKDIDRVKKAWQDGGGFQLVTICEEICEKYKN